MVEHLMRDCGLINPTIQSSNHPVLGLVPEVGIAPTSPPLQGGANPREIGCQGWTRTNTERLNRPPCYFDTTWQWLIGAAGRTSTCIVPLRRRMPDVFDHGSNLRMVGTAGFPPAASRSQAGRSED